MKLLGKFFVAAFISAFLVSCEKDDALAYTPTLDNLSVLTGTYAGTCKVSITDKGSYEEPLLNTNVRLANTTKKNVLALETDEFGLIIEQGDILTNFKKTDGEYTCNVKGFYFEYTYPKEKNDYIHTWFGDEYSDAIRDIKITISPSSATISSRTLKFTCKGVISFTGVYGDNQRQESYKIKYEYSVVKKDE